MKKTNFFSINKTKTAAPFKFKPVNLPTKKAVSTISKKNLTWPQAQKRYPKIKMFGDADKDGKLNMFDCKPFDRKRHGWKQEHKQSAVVNIPIRKAYYNRGRYGMNNTAYTLRDPRVVEVEEHQSKNKELTYNEAKEQLRIVEMRKRSKALEKKGYEIKSAKIKKGKYSSHGEIKYKRSAKVYNRDIDEMMTPVHDSGELMSYGDKKGISKYMKKLKKSISSDEEEVPMIKAYRKDFDNDKSTGEGRHRILAAMEAGEESIPYEIIDSGGHKEKENLRELRVEEEKGKKEKREEAPGILLGLEDEDEED